MWPPCFPVHSASNLLLSKVAWSWLCSRESRESPVPCLEKSANREIHDLSLPTAPYLCRIGGGSTGMAELWDEKARLGATSLQWSIPKVPETTPGRMSVLSWEGASWKSVSPPSGYKEQKYSLVYKQVQGGSDLPIIGTKQSRTSGQRPKLHRIYSACDFPSGIAGLLYVFSIMSSSKLLEQKRLQSLFLGHK